MAITVKHKFVSAIPDAGDPTIVQPSNWNDSHDLVGTVPVANGGTGAATLTGYVKGNGTANMTAASTIPSTDITGLGTMSTQNSNNISVTGGSMNGVTISDYVATATKGVANGVASLDGSGTVPVSQLPAAVLGALSYQGTWNASTNTPTLTSSVGTKGYYYVVNVAGSTNLNGITDWQVGDWAVYNGSAWQKIDNTDAVTSVNGYTGTVVLGYGDITTGVVPVVNGGTGVTVSSGANSVVLRDANGNITTNCLFEGFTTQAASGTTIVLVASSVQNWQITGSGGQIIRLPDATTLPNGATFTFNNNQSSGAITVQNNSSTTVATINSGGYVTVVLLSNSIAAGSWDRHDSTPSNVSWSTNTLDYAGSITSATWNGSTVQVNRGGTGATTLTGYVKGSGTSALTAASTIPTTDLSGTITNAQLANSAITINGTSTSLGGSVSVGTVTSVAATAGTGISVTGSPITSSGTLNITNTAPDQTVVLTAGTGISTSGTYPNFTITNTSPSSGGTVTSVTGTSPVVSSGGNTPAISMPAATTSVSGYLTSTDWNTFNNKGSGTVTSVSGTTGRITSTGGTTPVIDLASGVATAGTTGSSTLIPVVTIDTYGRVTSITTASNPQGTVTSVTGTAPVVSSGGATPAISMAAATGSVNGYLTSTDWTTFNNKGSGSVTSVSGTGTVNGITLTGTVTSSGSLTLGGTLSNVSLATQVTGNLPVTNLNSGTGATSSTYWRGDGTWAAVSVSPAGSNTQVQYNNSGAFGASSSFTYASSTLTAPIVSASNGLVVNSATVSASYSLPSGSNAMSVGPITVASGQSVTVASGQRWVVL
jgi:hypothetical protein